MFMESNTNRNKIGLSCQLKAQSKIILQLFHKLTLASLSIWQLVCSSRYLGELAAVS